MVRVLHGRHSLPLPATARRLLLLQAPGTADSAIHVRIAASYRARDSGIGLSLAWGWERRVVACPWCQKRRSRAEGRIRWARPSASSIRRYLDGRFTLRAFVSSL